MSLSIGMKKNPDILEELKEISPHLVALQNINVFTVPDGYFDALPNSVRGKIAMDRLSEMRTDTGEMLGVPDGYFKNLSASIMEKIKGQEQEQSQSDYMPLIPEQMKAINVYQVPENYFQGLPQAILDKIKDQSGARVVPLFRRPVMRYAVAAVVAVLLLVAVFFTTGDFNQQNSFAVVNKKTVPDPSALQYNSEKAFEKGLASLTDDQIIAYLENHGSILDNEQLIKNTDMSAMPDPMDYLVNDDVLEEYLQTISNNRSVKHN